MSNWIVNYGHILFQFKPNKGQLCQIEICCQNYRSYSLEIIGHFNILTTFLQILFWDNIWTHFINNWTTLQYLKNIPLTSSSSTVSCSYSLKIHTLPSKFQHITFPSSCSHICSNPHQQFHKPPFLVPGLYPIWINCKFPQFSKMGISRKGFLY